MAETKDIPYASSHFTFLHIDYDCVTTEFDEPETRKFHVVRVNSNLYILFQPEQQISLMLVNSMYNYCHAVMFFYNT